MPWGGLGWGKKFTTSARIAIVDGNLRNIPMRVLYNGKGEKYLVEVK